MCEDRKSCPRRGTSTFYYSTAFAISAGLILGLATKAFTPTPAEVLKLKDAGVSEETIQVMLENEADNRVPSDKIAQSYATEGIGSWQLRDGRTIHSTEKRQLPPDYPTAYPTAPPFSPYSDPHVIITPNSRGRGAYGRK